MKPHSIKTLAACAVLAVLSACDQGLDIETPPATFTFSKGFDQSRLAEGVAIPFRTYEKSDSASKQTGDEIKGARCTLKSKELETSFVTPALVDMPVIKGKPSRLEVTCSANGKTITRVQDPFKPQTIVVGDPVSMVVGNILSAAVTAASDWWHYVDGQAPVTFVMD